LPGSERAYAAALLAGAAAWLAHSVYDWDWDIPGVTLPALVFLGVLAGRPPPAGPPLDVPPPGGRLRGLALAGAVVAMAIAAVSAVLPAWSRAVADDALAAVGSHPSAAQLDRADRRARLSARLDPLSVDGLFARAAIAERRGRLDSARGFLAEATRRQPDSVLAWYKLAQIEIASGDVAGLARASDRALALDPLSPFARELAGRAGVALTPAGASATATGTPLPLRGRRTPPASETPAGAATAQPAGG
jgi:tetratricopeptide (TPR) repeat protein